MKMLLNLFITVLCITLIPGILFGVFWYIATKKGWNTLRLFSAGMATLVIGISLILWYVTKDNWILIGGVVISVIQGIIILNWPTLSPKFVKRLKLRK